MRIFLYLQLLNNFTVYSHILFLTMNKTKIYTRELRIDNAVFIRDCNLILGEYVWQWKLHYLDDYWFGYLGNVTPDDLRPILLDRCLLSLLSDVIIPDLTTPDLYTIRGTVYRLVRSRYGWDIKYSKQRIANVRFLHQLQNLYYDLTGSDLINARNRERILAVISKPIDCSATGGAPYIRFGDDDSFNLGEDSVGNPTQYI